MRKTIKKIFNKMGYFICKKKYLRSGYDFWIDLKERISINVDNIFDVGANVGNVALKMAVEFPAAEICCFEPIKGTFDQLQKSVKGYNNINCFHLAFGGSSTNKKVKVFEREKSVFNSLRENSMNNNLNAAEEIVQVKKLDDFCSEKNIKQIDLLKIDTEGYELEVISGSKEMLQNGKIMAIYCEVGFNPQNRRNTYWDDLNKTLYLFGYSFYGLYDVSNLQIRTGGNYGNALYLHNSITK
ncbi:FkbM family methyltransferase [Candidatus Omnitrophota bacterium]